MPGHTVPFDRIWIDGEHVPENWENRAEPPNTPPKPEPAQCDDSKIHNPYKFRAEETARAYLAVIVSFILVHGFKDVCLIDFSNYVASSMKRGYSEAQILDMLSKLVKANPQTKYIAISPSSCMRIFCEKNGIYFVKVSSKHESVGLDMYDPNPMDDLTMLYLLKMIHSLHPEIYDRVFLLSGDKFSKIRERRIFDSILINYFGGTSRDNVEPKTIFRYVWNPTARQNKRKRRYYRKSNKPTKAGK